MFSERSAIHDSLQSPEPHPGQTNYHVPDGTAQGFSCNPSPTNMLDLPPGLAGKALDSRPVTLLANRNPVTGSSELDCEGLSDAWRAWLETLSDWRSSSAPKNALRALSNESSIISDFRQLKANEPANHPCSCRK